MRRERMDGLDNDSDGVAWVCEWWKLEGYPIEHTTRVLLQKLGTDEFTHYYDAPFPADIFKPRLIDRDFSAVPRSL